MKKPNLFVIGAPKCGTTTLCHLLSEHPDVFVPPKKELHFFNDDGLRACQTIADYEANFQDVISDVKYVVDGSTHYLYSLTAVSNILEYCPSAKFIVCARNPVDMAVSLHAERLWQGMENVVNFAEAWEMRRSRNRKNVPRAVRGHESLLDYEEMARLGTHIRRVMKLVSKENLFLILLDDMRVSQHQVMQKLSSFLEIPDEWHLGQTTLNARKSVRQVWVSIFVRWFAGIKRKSGIRFSTGILNQLLKINTTVAHDAKIDEKTLTHMHGALEKEVRLLEMIFERDLSHWLKGEK